MLTLEQDFSLKDTSPLFGPYATRYSDIVQEVMKDSKQHRYIIHSNETLDDARIRDFEKLGSKFDSVLPFYEQNKILTNDFLNNFHLASNIVIMRSMFLLKACFDSYNSRNIFAFANNLRALIEFSSEYYQDFLYLSRFLAANLHPILRSADGFEHDRIDLGKQEKIIEHFYFARKISNREKKELNSDDFFVEAKTSKFYIDQMEIANFAGLYKLYSELCKFSHPSNETVNIFIEVGDEGYILSTIKIDNEIENIVVQNKFFFWKIVAYCFSPPLLALRVLAKFKIQKPTKGLRRFDFSDFSTAKDILNEIEH